MEDAVTWTAVMVAAFVMAPESLLTPKYTRATVADPVIIVTMLQIFVAIIVEVNITVRAVVVVTTLSMVLPQAFIRIKHLSVPEASVVFSSKMILKPVLAYEMPFAFLTVVVLRALDVVLLER